MDWVRDIFRTHHFALYGSWCWEDSSIKFVIMRLLIDQVRDIWMTHRLRLWYWDDAWIEFVIFGLLIRLLIVLYASRCWNVSLVKFVIMTWLIDWTWTELVIFGWLMDQVRGIEKTYFSALYISWYCDRVLQCVAVSCNVLQCVAVSCSVVQYVAVCCGVLRCVAVCCSVLQCVAVCCSVLQCVAVCCSVLLT